MNESYKAWLVRAARYMLLARHIPSASSYLTDCSTKQSFLSTVTGAAELRTAKCLQTRSDGAPAGKKIES